MEDGIFDAVDNDILGQVEKGESGESGESGENSPFSNFTSKKGNFPSFRFSKKGKIPLFSTKYSKKGKKGNLASRRMIQPIYTRLFFYKKVLLENQDFSIQNFKKISR